MTSKRRLEELISITHRHGLELKRTIEVLKARGHSAETKVAELLHRSHWLERLNEQRRRELHHLEAMAAPKEHSPVLPKVVPPKMVTMFDSIDVAQIPRDAVAVAGYVGGHWPTYWEILKMQAFVHAKKLSIAVNSSENADCLDVESGDAIPADVPHWYWRQKLRGAKRPCIYASLSVMPAIEKELALHHIGRRAVRLWGAHYTNAPHIPLGYDACQWTDKAMGRNLDQSLCFGEFWQ